jgi:hypothetical protein
MRLSLQSLVLCSAMLLLAQQQLYAQSHRHSTGLHTRGSYSSSRSYTARSHRNEGHSYRRSSPRISYRAHRPSARVYTPRAHRSRTYALRTKISGRGTRPSHRVHSFRASRYRAHAYSAPGTRDHRGRLKRSARAKDAFMRETGHPRGWPGHVVDHRVPLACGGLDSPSNMQWQTIEAARAKDKSERRGCRAR